MPTQSMLRNSVFHSINIAKPWEVSEQWGRHDNATCNQNLYLYRWIFSWSRRPESSFIFTTYVLYKIKTVLVRTNEELQILSHHFSNIRRTQISLRLYNEFYITRLCIIIRNVPVCIISFYFTRQMYIGLTSTRQVDMSFCVFCVIFRVMT